VSRVVGRLRQLFLFVAGDDFLPSGRCGGGGGGGGLLEKRIDSMPLFCVRI